MANTRIPTQKRGIEKKEQIIKKGFQLMCNNGYYNTTTPEIAKYAGVSTGIIYQYFKDKKDIFIAGAKLYANDIMFPIFSIIDEHEKLPTNIKPMLKELITTNKKRHTQSKKAHQELTAMEHLDEDIGNIFKEQELIFCDKLYNLFLNNNVSSKNLKEKVHLIVGIIDDIAHEEAYHKHKSLDYDKMEDIVIDSIIAILNN